VTSWRQFHFDLYEEYKPNIETRVDMFSALAPKIYAGNFGLEIIEVNCFISSFV
jgi:hypothetical protein